MPDFDVVPEITAVVGGFGEGLVGQLWGTGPVKAFGGSHTPQTIYDVAAVLGGAALSLYGQSRRMQNVGVAAMVGGSWALASRLPLGMGVKSLGSSASAYAVSKAASPCGCGGAAKPAPFMLPLQAHQLLTGAAGAVRPPAPYAVVDRNARPGSLG